MPQKIIIQGIFVADLAFWSKTLPQKGETVIGSHFHINPGGKGSNQAVAASRAGGEVWFLTKIGDDSFGEMALNFYQDEGISRDLIFRTKDTPTGAAGISICEQTGENAIIVVPGAAGELTQKEIDQAIPKMKEASLFLTQLETPVEISFYGLKLAKEQGLRTVLNPAPATKFSDRDYALIDIITPNEVEAEQLVGFSVQSEDELSRAADFFLERGVGIAIITLGERGCFVKTRKMSQTIPAYRFGKVIDTTGAGDAFNGALVTALSEEKDIMDAVRFANAAAGLSVTKKGTARSAPLREEIERMLRF